MQSTFRTLALAAAFCAAGSASAASIEVRVQGVTAKGKVLVAVCDKTTFLKDCAYSGSAPAKAGETVVTVDGVPTGSWAVLSYQDENDNGKLDTNLIGIPKEGIAVSNDAMPKFSAPRFAETAFALTGDADQRITLVYR